MTYREHFIQIPLKFHSSGPLSVSLQKKSLYGKVIVFEVTMFLDQSIQCIYFPGYFVIKKGQSISSLTY